MRHLNRHTTEQLAEPEKLPGARVSPIPQEARKRTGGKLRGSQSRGRSRASVEPPELEAALQTVLRLCNAPWLNTPLFRSIQACLYWCLAEDLQFQPRSSHHRRLPQV